MLSWLNGQGQQGATLINTPLRQATLNSFMQLWMDGMDGMDRWMGWTDGWHMDGMRGVDGMGVMDGWMGWMEWMGWVEWMGGMDG